MLITLLSSLSALGVLSMAVAGVLAWRTDGINDLLREEAQKSTEAHWAQEEVTDRLESLKALYRHDLVALQHLLGNAATVAPSPEVLRAVAIARTSWGGISPEEVSLVCLNWLTKEVLDKTLEVKSPMVGAMTQEAPLRRLLESVRDHLYMSAHSSVFSVITRPQGKVDLEILFRAQHPIPPDVWEVWTILSKKCAGTLSLNTWPPDGQVLTLTFCGHRMWVI